MIITLTGPNSFRLNNEVKDLINKYRDKFGDFGLEKLDGEEVPSARMIEAAHSLPFLAPKKMLILRNPSFQKQFAESIEQVIKDVPGTNDLVIVEPKIDRRSSYFKLLKTKTEFNEYLELDTTQLNNWIVQYIKTSGGSISSTDANYLIERVGQNQLLLAQELDKLVIYNPKIARDAIESLTERSPQSSIFELLDAAFSGNTAKAIELYNEQRALKVEPQQIIAMIAWQLHVLAVIKSSGQRSIEEIVKQAKLNPYVLRKSANIAKNIRLTDVKLLVGRAFRLDLRLKTQNIDANDALQYFLLTITL